MAGLYDTDIKLDENWQLTPATNGDAPLVSNAECIIQDIRIEAASQEGELFYDRDWGWSLLDFLQAQDDDLTRLEIEQRVKTKLSKREVIDNGTIKTKIEFLEDMIFVRVSFKFINDLAQYNLDVGLDRVKVEVVIV